MVAELTPLLKWRLLAYRFHAVECLVDTRRLPVDLEPAHLEELLETGPLTPSERGVLCFLLHTWDRENPFDLSQSVGWDRQHRRVLADWITGAATGEPGHYF